MDRELVDRVRAGDREAFDLIVAAKSKWAYGTALAILGNDADAWDAAQEAFAAAWRGIGGLKDVDRFDAWFGRILVNRCRTTLRRRRRVRELDLDKAADALAPSGALDGADFDEAFDRLSVDQRTILVLHHLHGYGVREMAAWLGIPTGTVKWRLNRARNALQRELDAT